MTENAQPRHVSRYDLVTPMIPCHDEIMAGFERILMSGNYILGEEVRLLEREMAEIAGVADAVGVASGSEALYLALAMAGVRPGTEVITTPYTFDATIEAVIMLHARPVFVDIRPGDLNIDPDLIERRSRRARAPSCRWTSSARRPTWTRSTRWPPATTCRWWSTWRSRGARCTRGAAAADFGRMSTLSFYPTKNLPGIGDGGMVFCREQEDGDRIRQLRGHKALWINKNLYCGWNSRLDEIQAMVIRTRLARFNEEQADRNRVAARSTTA
jgi:dTDP-4-amino-4,6-dideoxygalactose transaminase